MINIKNILKIKSLKWQLLFRFLIVLVILLVTIGIFQYVSMREYLYGTKVQVLHERFHNIDMASVSKLSSSDLTESISADIINKLWDKSMSIAIIDDNGNILFQRSNINKSKDNDHKVEKSKGPFKIIEMPVPVFSKEYYESICDKEGNLETTFKIIQDENSNYQLAAWTKIGNPNSPSGLIQLSTSIEDINDILMRQIYVHVSISILVLVIGAILGTTLFKRTLKPLYSITDTVEGISVTDLDTRLSEENGQLEIDRLSKSFNIMITRMQDSFDKEQIIREKMRRFVSDASHELRTPLTSIHGFVEVLLRGAAKNKEQLDLALNSILMESERLTKLVNDLLILTKLDQKPIVEMKKEDINELISEIEPQLKVLSKTRNLQFELGENTEAIINRDQIKQVIFNLTQNAVLHTDKVDGKITISTDMEKVDNNNFVVLRVIDNGTGIPPKDLAKIYDRFFRSETHRARSNGGYGLGLSIVKAIIDSNRGKINVESELNIGTVFTIYLRT